MKQEFYADLQTKSSKKTAAVLLLTLVLSVVSMAANAQIFVTLYKETFPTVYNMPLSSPVNGSFNGCTGNWATSSSSTLATEAVMATPYTPVTNALKFVHWSTAGNATATTQSVSPIYNFGNPGCNGKYDISFNLYTYVCTSGDNQSFLALDFSGDGGTTWTTAWQRTSGQMFSSNGVNGLTNIMLAIPASNITANFRYRFRSQMNASNPNNFYVFVDDVTLYAYACSDLMNLGNLVWLDLNLNGIKDAAETGLAGVPLELTRDNDLDGLNDWDFTPRTTTTDLNGHYSFNNLNAGRYKVQLAGINNIYRLTGTNAGQPDEDGDNNNNGLSQTPSFTNIEGGWITLLPQSEPTADGDNNNGNLTYDFAVFPASLLPAKSVTISLNYSFGQTVVNWQTINEINVLAFEVERSVDNRNFEKIATKASTATPNGNAVYSTTDVTGNSFAPVIYYRIKTIDKDGRFNYSATASIRTATAVDAVSVWPNPFVTEIKITHTAVAAEKILVKLTDNTGKILKQQTFNCAGGVNQFSMQGLDKLCSGVYLATINVGANKPPVVHKIIK
jgi:hypothetical protein